ncbi:FAD-dependent oxidoreductase [Gluconobacter oxydans]|uniref:FAD-dependent oxidoreductase n=1 Tax=Gluconobacter oxydans TaxID=442 RepID=UPI002647CF1B|nr:FAD/NAD(P)-binding protein [Gluconobacter oxydans]WKE48632.1 NAD(P)/FAD-dependent oxidoreductase [Gluconobacter oxydans]
MAGKRTITIIGGGVIGLTSACALIRDGHDVTLIERRDDVGREASWRDRRTVD